MLEDLLHQLHTSHGFLMRVSADNTVKVALFKDIRLQVADGLKVADPSRVSRLRDY